MADLTLKKDDTWPPLRATLTDTNGPIDLTGATSVKLFMVSPSFTVTGVCTVDNAVGGIVSYPWASGDLANVGEYTAEFQITWPLGKIETVPNDGYLAISVIADLGD